ncbi:MAG: serine hydrolase domain-containing protein [Natronomonas sp.]
MAVVPTGTDRIEQLFENHLEVGLHHGAQLAVYHEGELIVDLAGGVTGPDGDAETTDTRHLLFSCTKPLAAACVHRLVEAGYLAYDDRLVDHWPEFADEGTEKVDVTVRHVLTHQAGMPIAPPDNKPEMWQDPDALAAAIESADLMFTPGEAVAYHALSYGWLVGELVRRVAGQRIDRYAREHVFDPLGMDRTHIGLPADEPDDVATLFGFEPMDRCREPDTGLEGMSNSATAERFNREDVHRGIAPAATGIGTARELARFYACYANGGSLDGVSILDPETVETATSLQVEVEEDGTVGVPRRYALGFGLGGTVPDTYGAGSPPDTFGHGGLGTSVGWADPEAELAVAYVTNGIRDWENTVRQATMGDTIRSSIV